MCSSSYTYSCVFMWVPAYGVQRLAPKISLEYIPLTLSLLTHLDWPAINPPGDLVVSPVLDTSGHHHVQLFYMGTKRSNLGLHGYIASPLVTAPNFQTIPKHHFIMFLST